MPLARSSVPLAALAALLVAACSPYKAEPTRDVIYMPTPPAVVERMLQMADVRSDDILYDLGSGDGRIVIRAAKERGAHGTGVEIDPQLIAESKRNAAAAGVTDKVRFVEADLFTFDFHDATVVTLYLGRSLNVRLRDRILKELAPGTRVVSHAFDMGAWEPDEKAVVEERDVFSWIVPADVAGTWRWVEGAGRGGQPVELALRQSFQRASGALRRGGVPEPIRQATLRGERLTFSVPDRSGGTERIVRYDGRVIGDRIEGTIDTGTARLPWVAQRIGRDAGLVKAGDGTK
jgi:hypothetical protein